jgi:hypothetical protein
VNRWFEFTEKEMAGYADGGPRCHTAGDMVQNFKSNNLKNNNGARNSTPAPQKTSQKRKCGNGRAIISANNKLSQDRPLPDSGDFFLLSVWWAMIYINR